MKQLGRYLLEAEVARGGMGVVYRGRHAETGERVAVKLLFEHDPRFEQESRVLAALDHPGIVGHRDAFEVGGQQVLVMEWVAGESLQDRLKRDGPLPVPVASALAGQLCDALGHAHRRGVIHRDLKPHNVLLPPGGPPRLADFGLGKQLRGELDARQSLTQTGEVMGTPAYMPPEQAAGHKHQLGPAADIYGLGATLYAALTGRPPFQAPTLLNVLNAVLTEPPEPPSRLRPDLPPSLEALILRCLAKDPGERFPSTEALARELRPFAPAARAPRSARWASLVLIGLGLTAAGTIVVLRAGAPKVAGFSAEAWQRECDATVEASDWPSVIDQCDRALRHDPTFAKAWRVRAGALAELKRYDEAERDVRRALTLEPDGWKNHHWLAVILREREGPAAATPATLRAIELAPAEEHLSLAHEQARALLLADQPRAAIAVLDRLQAPPPDSPGAWTPRSRAMHLSGQADCYLRDASLLGQRGEREASQAQASIGQRLLNDALDVYPLPEAYISRAEASLAFQGDHELALYDLSAAIDATPGPSTNLLLLARHQRARLLVRRNRFEDAVDDLDWAIERADSVELRLFRAQLHGHLELYDAAFADSTRALELAGDAPFPQRLSLLAMRATWRVKLEQFAEAERDLDDVLAQTPDDATFLHMLRALVRARRGNLAGARVDFAALEAAGGASAQARLLRALLHASLSPSTMAALVDAMVADVGGREADALSGYAAVRPQLPPSLQIELDLQRVEVLLGEGRPGEAADLCTEVLRADGDGERRLFALARRAQAYRLAGLNREARADALELVGLVPRDPTQQLLVAQAHAVLRQFARAQAICDALLQEHPQWFDVALLRAATLHEQGRSPAAEAAIVELLARPLPSGQLRKATRLYHFVTGRPAPRELR